MSKKMARTTWRASFPSFNTEIRASSIGATRMSAPARPRTVRRRNNPAFNRRVRGALTTWQRTYLAFNRKIRGCSASHAAAPIDEARAPPTGPRTE